MTTESTPRKIIELRQLIDNAHGIIFSTPEYVFSIPSRLKNNLEWLVSTTVLTNKPVAIITASTQGEKGHKEIQLILNTLQANFTSNTVLLMKGIKGKIDQNAKVNDPQIRVAIDQLLQNFYQLMAVSNTTSTPSKPV